jgi:hypothetical protein
MLSPELVYVANADSGPVTAYPVTASGATAPTKTMNNPENPQTVWDPWGITFDTSGNLYVQTYLSDATSFVFAPGATTPTRIFRAAGPDIDSIAVDGQGYEYVIGGESAPGVYVVAPGASGSPSNLYSVVPLREIQPDQTGFSPWPSVLAVDDRNELVVAVNRSAGNAIEVYEGGPSGSNTPLRTIAGSHTGLGSCGDLSNCSHVAIAYAPLTGQIIATVSTATGSHISVFAGNANGNAAPLRTISGSQTGLNSKVVTGVAASARNGNIYVLAKSSQFGGTASVEVFSPSASGNIAPLRTFTDASTVLADGQGIALSR